MAKNKESSFPISAHEHIIELLVEYTEKLRSHIEKPRGLPGQRGPGIDGRFMAALHNLSSAASQRIEYSTTDDIGKLEITLRLAEFEILLNAVRHS